MKRDMDLCRRILLAVESSPANTWTQEFPFDNEYEAVVVTEHVALLEEAGLIDAHITRYVSSDPPDFVIRSLTWYGHDFLDAARDEGRWARAKQRLADAGVGTTFTLLKEMLEALARGELGLGS